MKRSIVQACALFAVVYTQATMAQINEPSHASTSCGTELAMAKMPGELKTSMASAATVSQADELLLYINFNPNGSTVRQGFGNADTLTSPIVPGVRFCPAPLLSQDQKDEIVRLVSDEFSPFNIRITTDAAVFAAYPRQNKQMCLITTTPAVIGFSSGTGGVSPFAGVGFRLPGDFAFAFSSQVVNDPHGVAAIVAHESAHLLGLGHQHLFSETCGFLTEYHPGFGFGPLAFNPLMGDGFGDGINNWFAQVCPSPVYGVPQNDYELINSQVIIQPDDFPDEPGGKVVGSRQITGVLERAGDVDHIKIKFRNPGPVFISSDNIDLQVKLLRPNGEVIETFNDPDSPNVVIPSARGMKYLKIKARRNENMRARFMTGTYRISY